MDHNTSAPAAALKPNTNVATVLPTTIVAPADVLRIIRELTALDDFLHQASLRKGGAPAKVPVTSRNLEAIVALYGLNLLQAADRTKLLKTLDHIRLTSPQVHISFAADPSPQFTDKIVNWLRQNIHPMLLVQIGLQPSIAAGCIVRTTNKQFDFSLRQHFTDSRPLLVQKIKEAVAS
jgi:hypothetical protein